MKVSLFEQVPYRYLPEGFENHHNSVVTPPYRFVEPGRMQESLLSAYAGLMHGARAGFDGVCVTEHSQSSYDISPNPNLLASAVACAAQAEGLDVAITVLGRSLGKTREPLKIAEEVLPRLRTIWDAEGWAHPWWPRAQGTTGAVTEAAAGGKA